MRHAARATLLIVAMFAPMTSDAQEPGSRVRIAAPALGGSPVVATLVAITPDSITVEPVLSQNGRQVGTGPKLLLARTALTQFDVRVGSRTQTLKGMRLGAFSGLVVGGVLGAATYTPCTSTEILGCLFAPTSPMDAAYLVGMVGAVLGVGVGAIFGAFAVTDRWKPAAIGAVSRLRIAPSGNGVAAQMSFTLP